MRDLLFVGLFALFLTNTHAADINVLTYDATGDTVIITDCAEDASGDLVIPDTIGGKPVTSIGRSAFYNCFSLTSITIPDSVTSIGDYVFGGLSSLSDITIGISVTSIGDRAFSGCTSLMSITIPDGVTSIGEGAFANCANLTSITIPNGVTSIGAGPFSGCESLTTIEVGEGNMNFTGINGVLFNAEKTVLVAYPTGKAGANYKIHDGVTSIGGSAFSKCTSLTSITIPDGVISIGSSAFRGCSSLSDITIPDSVISIGYGALSMGKSLSAVTFLGDAPKKGLNVFNSSVTLTIYRKPEAKGWGDTWAERPVKLISEKP